MVARISLRVVSNDFPKIRAAMHDKADRICRETAFEIEGRAKAGAPVDTGALKNSIQSTRIGHAHQRVAVGVEYGIYQEFGTRYMAAQPYFTPAVHTAWPRFQDRMKKVVG